MRESSNNSTVMTTPTGPPEKTIEKKPALLGAAASPSVAKLLAQTRFKQTQLKIPVHESAGRKVRVLFVFLTVVEFVKVPFAIQWPTAIPEIELVLRSKVLPRP